MWKSLTPKWTMEDEKRFIRLTAEHYKERRKFYPTALSDSRAWLRSYLKALELRRVDFSGHPIKPALIESLERYCCKLLLKTNSKEAENHDKNEDDSTSFGA